MTLQSSCSLIAVFGLHLFELISKTLSKSMCYILLPVALAVNTVGLDWEIKHRTRWCRGLMSPNSIPSPCGIPLIFSSAQITFYSHSFSCYCNRHVSQSNLPHLIWGYFHIQYRIWQVFGDFRETRKWILSKSRNVFLGVFINMKATEFMNLFFSSWMLINTNDISGLLCGAILWS